MEQQSYFTRDVSGALGGVIKLVPNPGTLDVINYAVNSYGFLIECGETVTPTMLIARIKSAYDCETVPQNRAVISALACLI